MLHLRGVVGGWGVGGVVTRNTLEVCPWVTKLQQCRFVFTFAALLLTYEA